MITVVSFIVVLGILVFFHELGHYWVARRNGIIVDEFGMGYPPRLVKLFTYDGTDFTINLIPFGGFARMRGEDAADMAPGTFNGASRGARAATLIAGPAMNALLAIILFAISFVDGFPAPAAVPQISNEISAELIGLGFQPGDVLLAFNGQPIYMNGRNDLDYEIKNTSVDNSASGAPMVTVSRDGVEFEIALPAGTTADSFLSDGPFVGVLSTQITQVADNTPAQRAGLMIGDQFYKVDDEVVTTDNPLNEIINREAGNEVVLTILRDSGWKEISITPRTTEETPPGEGKLGVGIGSISQIASLSWGQALWQGVNWTFDYFGVVLKLPFMLFAGEVSPSDARFTGPVGIANMIGGAVDYSLESGLRFPIWHLSAILSAALAITNMLPLPALDGGRLLFILIETIRGRRVSPEREGVVHMVGFMLLLGLIVVITVQDITSAGPGIDWGSILGR